jgi:hypothetical protein
MENVIVQTVRLLNLRMDTKEWYLNGKLHRKTDRLLNKADGDKSWYLNGELHRTDGPAKDWPSEGIQEWYFEGKKVEPMFHECKAENGTKKYFNEKGELHHTHGPAMKTMENPLESKRGISMENFIVKTDQLSNGLTEIKSGG